MRTFISPVFTVHVTVTEPRPGDTPAVRGALYLTLRTPCLIGGVLFMAVDLVAEVIRTIEISVTSKLLWDTSPIIAAKLVISTDCENKENIWQVCTSECELKMIKT